MKGSTKRARIAANRGKSVLNVVWDDEAAFEIVSYEPGEWERSLTGRASPANLVEDSHVSNDE